MIPRKEKKYPGKHNMHLPVLRLTSQMPSFQCYFYEKADLPAMIKYGMNKLQQISQYLKPQTNFSTNMWLPSICTNKIITMSVQGFTQRVVIRDLWWGSEFSWRISLDSRAFWKWKVSYHFEHQTILIVFLSFYWFFPYCSPSSQIIFKKILLCNFWKTWSKLQ